MKEAYLGDVDDLVQCVEELHDGIINLAHLACRDEQATSGATTTHATTSTTQMDKPTRRVIM